MALLVLNNTGNPYGQFDGYDTELTGFLGGEVCKLVGVQVGQANDKAASDISDGYATSGLLQARPVVTKVLSALTYTDGYESLFLADDGSLNYGTLFGVVVGGTAGAQVSGGTALGPHTAVGSGKITLWKNPGLYGVTLDALDTTFAASTALSVGLALYASPTGKVCLSAQKATNSPKVATLVEFSAGDTLVSTPRSLTRVGIVGGTVAFKYAVIDWKGV